MTLTHGLSSQNVLASTIQITVGYNEGCQHPGGRLGLACRLPLPNSLCRADPCYFKPTDLVCLWKLFGSTLKFLL